MSSRSVASQWADEDLASIAAAGLTRRLEPLSTAQGRVVRIGSEELLNFSSNDYLGLAGEPKLVEAATRALREVGSGSGASRLVVGDTVLHAELEQRLASFMGSPAAVLFNSGYAANVGILQALCGPQDVLFSDALNHASLIDGCRLSRAKVVIYPHGDVATLDKVLAQTSGRRRLVCTDSIFSMDGDRAPLVDLVEVCTRHGAALLVDEAHAIGVVGRNGRGLCSELGIEHAVDIRMGTLGKAFGAFGAYAATSRSLADLFVNKSRSLIFSTSFPAAWCAASIAAMELVEDDTRRNRLWRNIRRLSDGLNALGYAATPSSAVFSVILGEPERALEASALLRAQGLLVKPIRPPTVPAGTSRLRITLSAAHEPGDIDRLLNALRNLPWPPRT
jgi:8-amino-7-oxononanoate synthase